MIFVVYIECLHIFWEFWVLVSFTILHDYLKLGCHLWSRVIESSEIRNVACISSHAGARDVP